MLTMRPIEPSGKWGQKSHSVNGVKKPTTDWNDRANSNEWRELWADEVNAVLKRENCTERIDHRSNKERGIDELPTVHMGVAACRMEKKGIRTERGNQNRKINSFNNELRQLKARLNKLDEWLKAETAKPEAEKPPTLYEVINNILSRQSVTKLNFYQSVNNLKASAKMMNFLSENSITDYDDLVNKLHSMIGKQRDIANEIKPIERRLKTLDVHIQKADDYFEYKPIYEEYEGIKRPKKKQAFAYKYDYEMKMYNSAKTYIDDVMNGKRPIPRKAWRKERENLTAEKDRLYQDYYTLKNEVKEIEQIKKSVYEILKLEERERQPTREYKHETEI